eukprot:gene3678-7946_t
MLRLWIMGGMDDDTAALQTVEDARAEARDDAVRAAWAALRRRIAARGPRSVVVDDVAVAQPADAPRQLDAGAVVEERCRREHAQQLVREEDHARQLRSLGERLDERRQRSAT